MKPRIKLSATGKGLSGIKKVLAEADGLSAEIGILGSGNVRVGQTSNVEIGLIHEFGAPDAGIPERSFLRSTFDTRMPELKRLSNTLAKNVYDEGSASDALGLMGAFLSAEVKKTIVNHIPPPLAQATIDRKGSSTPLVDTGQLINSITWVVRK